MIAFTICSNNYLAQALSLGHSLVKNGFDSKCFFIFLVDDLSSEIDYEKLSFTIIPIAEEIVPDFISLIKKYYLVELNTAVKPSIFKYLIRTYKESYFCYLDPDLFFYQNINVILKELGESSIMLTPHITNPTNLLAKPSENTFLNYGLYNLGFLLVKNDEIGLQMLNWWEERTLNLCYDKPSEGIFVDQLWINLVPIYYDGVKISKNKGLNVAYWNLNERKMSYSIDKYIVNNNEQLIFFHFSSFDESLLQLTRREHSITDEQWPLILQMMTEYKENLTNNDLELFRRIYPKYKITFEEHTKRNYYKVFGKVELIILRICNKIIPKKLLKSIRTLNNKLDILNKYYSI